MRPDRTFCQDVPVKRGESSCLKTGFKTALTVRQKTRCNLVLLFWWIYRAEAFSLFLLPYLQKTNLFTQQENLISTPVGHNREHKPHTPDRNSVSSCAALLSRKTRTQTQIWQHLVQFTAVAALANPTNQILKVSFRGGWIEIWLPRLENVSGCKWHGRIVNLILRCCGSTGLRRTDRTSHQVYSLFIVTRGLKLFCPPRCGLIRSAVRERQPRWLKQNWTENLRTWNSHVAGEW